MSFWFTRAASALFKGDLDMDEAAADLRLILVMANCTASIQEDVEFVADISVLDEYDGSGYARAALASQAVNVDTTNNRSELSATNTTWAGLGAGTRQAIAMILYKHVGADSANPLVAYIDDGGFPTNGTGGDMTVTWNAEGILQAVCE